VDESGAVKMNIDKIEKGKLVTAISFPFVLGDKWR
jgi:hypothetical protein